MEGLRLNVPLLRQRVPNLTARARRIGLRAATVSDLCRGKISVGRAEIRTLVALADLAGCTLDDLLLKPDRVELIASGIKALDLFAPLVRGGITGFVARKNVGQLALLQELFHRFRAHGAFTVCWLGAPPECPDASVWPSLSRVRDLAAVLAESAAHARRLLEQHAVHGPVLFACDRRVAVTGELSALLEGLSKDGYPPTTVILLDLSGSAGAEDAPYGPLDTLVKFDPDLAARQLYPAIDPLASTSIWVEASRAESPHLSTRRQAQHLLRRYRELRPLASTWGKDRLGQDDRVAFERGARLEAFFSQSFATTEAWSEHATVAVPVEPMLEDVRRILDGAVDAWPIEQLLYRGALNV